MKTDSIALTARGKVICQDVARHGQKYIIVADGCSSSPHSEVGAMLLAMTARKLIESNLIDVSIGYDIISEAHEVSKSLGLPAESLDATLIIGYEIKNTFKVKVYGDGTVWCKDSSGIVSYQHESIAKINDKHLSLPYYLNYKLDHQREQKFLSANPACIVNGNEIEFRYVHEYLFAVPQIVGIATDGASVITDSSANKIALIDVLKKFSDFFIHEGAFLARRAWATLNRERWTLNDDFGMAVALWS